MALTTSSIFVIGHVFVRLMLVATAADLQRELSQLKSGNNKSCAEVQQVLRLNSLAVVETTRLQLHPDFGRLDLFAIDNKSDCTPCNRLKDQMEARWYIVECNHRTWIDAVVLHPSLCEPQATRCDIQIYGNYVEDKEFSSKPFEAPSYKLELIDPSFRLASRLELSNTVDSDTGTCIKEWKGFKLQLNRSAIVHYVRLYLLEGYSGILIKPESIKSTLCYRIDNKIEESGWYVIKCKATSTADSIIFNPTDANNQIHLRICEIEIYGIYITPVAPTDRTTLADQSFAPTTASTANRTTHAGQFSVTPVAPTDRTTLADQSFAPTTASTANRTTHAGQFSAQTPGPVLIESKIAIIASSAIVCIILMIGVAVCVVKQKTNSHPRVEVHNGVNNGDSVRVHYEALYSALEYESIDCSNTKLLPQSSPTTTTSSACAPPIGLPIIYATVEPSALRKK